MVLNWGGWVTIQIKVQLHYDFISSQFPPGLPASRLSLWVPALCRHLPLVRWRSCSLEISSARFAGLVKKHWMGCLFIAFNRILRLLFIFQSKLYSHLHVHSYFLIFLPYIAFHFRIPVLWLSSSLSYKKVNWVVRLPWQGYQSQSDLKEKSLEQVDGNFALFTWWMTLGRRSVT